MINVEAINIIAEIDVGKTGWQLLGKVFGTEFGEGNGFEFVAPTLEINQNFSFSLTINKTSKIAVSLL